MDQDLDTLEEEIKEQEKPKKKHKVSGRSVFRLQEIIKKKSQKAVPVKDGSSDSDSSQDLGRDSGDNQKTLAGDE